MNATFAKNEMTDFMPAGLSFRGTPDTTARMPVDEQRHATRGLGRKVADAIAHLFAMPRRRAVLDELDMLSDRELADIGLGRHELRRVFDPDFAREHALRCGIRRGLTVNG